VEEERRGGRHKDEVGKRLKGRREEGKEEGQRQNDRGRKGGRQR